MNTEHLDREHSFQHSSPFALTDITECGDGVEEDGVLYKAKPGDGIGNASRSTMQMRKKLMKTHQTSEASCFRGWVRRDKLVFLDVDEAQVTSAHTKSLEQPRDRSVSRWYTCNGRVIDLEEGPEDPK